MHYPAVLSVVISILITREMEETFGKIEGSKERQREKETERERECFVSFAINASTIFIC